MPQAQTMKERPTQNMRTDAQTVYQMSFCNRNDWMIPSRKFRRIAPVKASERQNTPMNSGQALTKLLGYLDCLKSSKREVWWNNAVRIALGVSYLRISRLLKFNQNFTHRWFFSYIYPEGTSANKLPSRTVRPKTERFSITKWQFRFNCMIWPHNTRFLVVWEALCHQTITKSRNWRPMPLYSSYSDCITSP